MSLKIYKKLIDLSSPESPIINRNLVNDSQTSKSGVIDKIKDSINETIDSIKNKLENVTSFVQLVPIIVADTSGYDFKNLIERFAGTSLTNDEYKRLIYRIKLSKSLPDIHSLGVMIESIRVEIQTEKEEQLLKHREEEEKVFSLGKVKSAEMCKVACEHLLRPLNISLTQSQIDQCFRIYIERYHSDLWRLFHDFNAFLKSSDDFFPVSSDRGNGFPNEIDNENNNINDDIYLSIARKYILSTNSLTINTLKKFQGGLSKIKIFDDFTRDTSECIESPLDNYLEIPVLTYGLILLWGALMVEFLDTAYGDIDVTKEQIIMASISIFGAIFIVALAREGIPTQLGIDCGVTHCIQSVQKFAYTSFHDYVKPVVDFGVNFANVAFEKSGVDIVITKNKTWNKVLYSQISTKVETAPLSMSKALPMLHTFRVANAFLLSLKNGKDIFSRSLTEKLLMLSPIPQNGEEVKMISLFWGNPYKDDLKISGSSSTYGVFFNYNQEIDLIYERHTKAMVDGIISILSSARDIYFAIRELNSQIGKGNPNIFDDYLIYCISGRLIERYYMPCLGNISQQQLASEIYNFINHSQVLA